jgi:YVTN family beta-propeller protein
MACPQVSAACAIMLEANPSLTPVDLKNALLSSATRIDTTYPNNNSGWGRLNVGGALNIVLPRNPTAEFAADTTSGSAPLTVHFTDKSTNTPTSWDWDFGDGATSKIQSPMHQYNAAGAYTVNLTVTNSYGSNTSSKKDYITVRQPWIEASFISNKSSGDYPLTVQFTDTSTGAPAPSSWDWDFGDGSAHASTQNPTHIYTVASTYTVTLSVTNAYITDSATGYVTVTEPIPTPPTAAFTADTTSGSAPLTVHFSDQSTNTPTSWDWDYGDSSTHGTIQNPTHQYTVAGTYTVTLTVTNAYGTDPETKAGYVTVTKPTPTWKTYISNTGGSTVSVINQSTDTVTRTITTGSAPYGIAYSPDGTLAYVAVESQNKVSVISTATDTIVNSITVGSKPRGVVMSPDGKRLYVGNYGGKSISVINTSDTNQYTVTGTITGITNPHELWVHPDGSRLYVSTYQSNEVYVINIENDANTIVSTLAGSRPYFISLDPAGARLFVANYNSNNIQVYDALSLNLQATINTAKGPLSPIISPDGSRLYYVTDGDNKLTIAYSNNYTVIKTVTCGSGVRGIACSPDGKNVYVTNMNSGTTSVVNVTNDAGTVKTVRVGSYPYGLGQFAGYYPLPA